MITKETARQIYNCHQQIEEIGKIKSDMCEEVEKARERAAKSTTVAIVFARAYIVMMRWTLSWMKTKVSLMMMRNN